MMAKYARRCRPDTGREAFFDQVVHRGGVVRRNGLARADDPARFVGDDDALRADAVVLRASRTCLMTTASVCGAPFLHGLSDADDRVDVVAQEGGRPSSGPFHRSRQISAALGMADDAELRSEFLESGRRDLAGVGAFVLQKTSCAPMRTGVP